jgi:hypothetical protein
MVAVISVAVDVLRNTFATLPVSAANITSHPCGYATTGNKVSSPVGSARQVPAARPPAATPAWGGDLPRSGALIAAGQHRVDSGISRHDCMSKDNAAAGRPPSRACRLTPSAVLPQCGISHTVGRLLGARATEVP